MFFRNGIIIQHWDVICSIAINITLIIKEGKPKWKQKF
jgi:hypothetical protein